MASRVSTQIGSPTLNPSSARFLVRGAIAALAVASIFMIALQTIIPMDVLNWDRWTFYDWLINYQSGFVRRGLAGEMIHALGYGHEVYILNGLAFFLGSALVTMLTVIALRIGAMDAKAGLLYAVSPAGYLGMALSNQYYYRKEAVFYLVILSVTLLYLSWKRHKRAATARVMLGIIGVSSLVLPFIHEGFLFFCVFYFYWVAREVLGYYFSGGGSRWISLGYVAVSLMLFITLSLFKGDDEKSHVIWASLSPAARAISGGDGILGGAVAAIGWKLSEGLMLSLKALESGMGTYYLFALAIVYLTVGYLHSVVSGGSTFAAYRDRRFNATFVAVCLVFLPLFALALDWGRWIVGIFIVSSSMIVCGISVVSDDRAAFLDRIFNPRTLTILFFCALFAVALTTKIPECCIGAGISPMTMTQVHPTQQP